MSGTSAPTALTAPSFSKKGLTLTITLGEGSFGEDGSTTATVEGLRCKATISQAGGLAPSLLSMSVYGLNETIGNQITTLRKPLPWARKNVVTLTATATTGAKAVAFQGIITQAWLDLAGAPQAVYHVIAQSGVLAALKPIAASSYPGTTPASTIFADLAGQMGLTLQNNGVDTVLSSPYLPGTATQQMQAVAEAAGCIAFIDEVAGVLSIWPRTGSRAGVGVPLISPDTGMVGYPAYAPGGGIVVKMLFNPTIIYGQPIEVKSSITQCNGTWPNMQSLSHEIDSELPGGNWFTTIQTLILGATS